MTSKLPFDTNYLSSINQYQTTFHHDSHHTHQLDHLQKLVELTEKIFEITVASQDTDDQSAKLHDMMDSLDTVKALRQPLKDIQNIYEGIDQSAKLDEMMTRLENIDAMRQPLKDIRNVSCEMSCNLLEGTGNVEKTTSTVLEKLQNYSWNEKTVLAVAAFAFSVLELSMLMKHRDVDPMAKLVHKVKGRQSLKLDLNTLDNLGKVIGAMKDVVRTNMVFLRDGFSRVEASSSTDEEMAFLQAEVATNKFIRIVLEISTILSKREDQIVDGELKRLETELNKINNILHEALNKSKRSAPGKMGPNQYDPYEDVGKPMPKINTSELIRKIKKYIQVRDHGKLENRHVLYLVSNLDISTEEIKVLKGLYKKNRQVYEIVWLPIVYSSANGEREQERFRELKQMMEWICVVEPLKNTEAAEVIGYIKRDWQFMKQTIAVSVNQEEEITCFNALPMLWIWGNVAFPFTEKKERSLWSEIDEQDEWKLDWLFDQLVVPADVDIRSWTKGEATFVCLFGGGEISWNLEFIEKMKYAAHVAGVSLKLVYMGLGGNNKGKGLTRNELGRDIHIIQSESQWQFWSQLESILYTKIKFGKKDRVMQEALKVVGYGGNGQAWAMFSMGPGGNMVTADGETALTIMKNYQNWMHDHTGIRFLEGIKAYMDLVARDVHNCINVNLPILGRIPGTIMCPECNKVMDMFYTYRCCVESRLCC